MGGMLDVPHGGTPSSDVLVKSSIEATGLINRFVDYPSHHGALRVSTATLALSPNQAALISHPSHALQPEEHSREDDSPAQRRRSREDVSTTRPRRTREDDPLEDAPRGDAPGKSTPAKKHPRGAVREEALTKTSPARIWQHDTPAERRRAREERSETRSREEHFERHPRGAAPAESTPAKTNPRGDVPTKSTPHRQQSEHTLTYSVTEEHKPFLLVAHNVNVPLAPYPTRVSSVVVRYPPSKAPGGAPGFAQLLNVGSKDKSKSRDDGISQSSSDTADDEGSPALDVSPSIEPHSLFAHAPAGPAKKRVVRPKQNIRTTSSTFITRIQTAEGSAKALNAKQGDTTFLAFSGLRSGRRARSGIQEDPSSSKEWDPVDNIFVTMPPWHPVSGLKTEKEKAVKNPVSHWRVSRKSIVDFVFSPDVKYVGAISEDGCLRVIDALAEQLVDCYASYFGALTCIAWSPDGRFILTGGQDDLLTIFSPWEQRVVARCQGHSSFVTSVAFDDLRCDGRTYRFGSVGEDNKLILWDFSSGTLHRPKFHATHHQRVSMSSTVSLAFRHDRSALHLPSVSPTDEKPYPRYHPAPSRNEVAVVQPVLTKQVEGDLLAAVAFLQRSRCAHGRMAIALTLRLLINVLSGLTYSSYLYNLWKNYLYNYMLLFEDDDPAFKVIFKQGQLSSNKDSPVYLTSRRLLYCLSAEFTLFLVKALAILAQSGSDKHAMLLNGGAAVMAPVISTLGYEHGMPTRCRLPSAEFGCATKVSNWAIRFDVVRYPMT
ncbi:hypothetical protein BDZ89DRAFT_1116762 [Hymenopellis radicata]|nr:hypothetical protein BDZ89DRAFT_1116762 [Hymenopellis radicata]